MPATSSLPSIPCLGSRWPWNNPLTCVHPWTGSTRRLLRLALCLRALKCIVVRSSDVVYCMCAWRSCSHALSLRVRCEAPLMNFQRTARLNSWRRDASDSSDRSARMWSKWTEEMEEHTSICSCICNQKPTMMRLVPRFEPDILLRAKQEFMKTDSATDLEWVLYSASKKQLCHHAVNV